MATASIQTRRCASVLPCSAGTGDASAGAVARLDHAALLSTLEEQWGKFKYQIYWLTGILATVCVALITRTGATPTALVMSLFLAFATRWPSAVRQ